MSSEAMKTNPDQPDQSPALAAVTGREQSSNQPQQVLENVYCIWFPGGSTDRTERGLFPFSEKPPGQVQSAPHGQTQ